MRGARVKTPGATMTAMAPWLMTAALLVLGLSATLPIEARGADADATEFSAERAMEHVARLARRPHPMGSTEIDRVRNYLVEEAERLGLETDLQTITVPDYYGGSEPVDVVNVIAWIPGTSGEDTVLLMAHYDTVPTTPGANDNAAAVAALLETARALRAGPPPANDVVFVFTDGEEPAARYGATAFAALPGVVDRLGLVVNLEANGRTGASLLAEVAGPQRWVVEQFAAADRAPAAFAFLTQLTRLLGEIGTDFDVFKETGVPGMHFAYLGGSPIYHTLADDIASVSRRSLQHHGSHALALARHFGNLDLAAPPREGDAVFFTVGRLLVAYPAGWTIPLAVAAAAAWVSALVRRRPGAGAVPFGRVGRATGSGLLALLLGAAAGTLLWTALARLRPTPGIVEGYGYMALVLVAGMAVARPISRRRDHADAVAQRWGAVTVWVLAALATVTLPGFGYLFVWPALAAVGGLWWRPRRPLAALARLASIATPAVVLVAPAVHVLFLFAQPRPGNPDSEIVAAAFAPMVLALLAAGLLAAGWHRPEPAADRRPSGRHRTEPAPAEPTIASAAAEATGRPSPLAPGHGSG